MTGLLMWLACGAVGFLALLFLQRKTSLGDYSELWESGASKKKVVKYVAFYVACGPITLALVAISLLGLWLE